MMHLQLPEKADPENVVADYKDGVLSVVIGKTSTKVARNIPVKRMETVPGDVAPKK